MGARGRVLAIVIAVAALAASATVALAVLTSEDARHGPGPREGVPPLALDLGVRTDPEAVALRRGERLYAAERRHEAERIFGRYDSPEARVGAALSEWPDSSLDRLERLGADHPRDAFVQLHLGLARLWAGEDSGALTAWRAAARVQPDSPSAIRADDLLHPNFPRGRPFFVPSFSPPPRVARLSPPRQLAFLQARARGGGVREKLLYGLALQRLGRPVSARREYDAAVRLAPGDPDARVAAAVVRFDKARPSDAFSRLGPLTRRFPRAQTVRFHLGLLLLWLARVQPGAVEEGKSQLRRARALAPGSRLGREATTLLDSLESNGTN
ncbi:MAG TPA: tetratricopeptide repeat protein [Gaiellaceae bacterium]|nr:tetratricopeptide repeat protein [Gaiellaceae bacterium]